jgi:RimJ/RimL family protein N-acetyltransferase
VRERRRKSRGRGGEQGSGATPLRRAVHPGLRRPGEVELGYRLRRAAWGQGYATEVSRALVRLAFTRLGAQRVVASTDAVHTACRRVLEKVGLWLARTLQAACFALADTIMSTHPGIRD